MIVPKFNANRIAKPGAIGDAIKTLASPLAKAYDKKAELNREAKNKAIEAKNKAIKKQQKAAKTYVTEPTKGKPLTPAQKRQNEAAASYMDYTPQKATATSKKAPSTRVRKPTAAAVGRQTKAAATYLTSSKKKLTPQAKAQNVAARSYMTKTSVASQSGAAPGRPDTKASSKIATPTAKRLPRTNVNKTAPRSRPKVNPLKPVEKTKAPAAPGRRKSGVRK